MLGLPSNVRNPCVSTGARMLSLSKLDKPSNPLRSQPRAEAGRVHKQGRAVRRQGLHEAQLRCSGLSPLIHSKACTIPPLSSPTDPRLIVMRLRDPHVNTGREKSDRESLSGRTCADPQ